MMTEAEMRASEDLLLRLAPRHAREMGHTRAAIRELLDAVKLAGFELRK